MLSPKFNILIFLKIFPNDVLIGKTPPENQNSNFWKNVFNQLWWETSPPKFIKFVEGNFSFRHLLWPLHGHARLRLMGRGQKIVFPGRPLLVAFFEHETRTSFRHGQYVTKDRPKNWTKKSDWFWSRPASGRHGFRCLCKPPGSGNVYRSFLNNFSDHVRIGKLSPKMTIQILG